MASSDAKVRLDLNNPVFQANLLTLQKPERHAALDTLNKIGQFDLEPALPRSRAQVGEDHQRQLPEGIDAIYSLRITQARRATAYREADFIRLLTIAPDHDATYGKK